MHPSVNKDKLSVGGKQMRNSRREEGEEMNTKERVSGDQQYKGS